MRGSEQDGIRPCLIVSPDSMNKSLSTLIVLPMTTQLKDWLSRIEISVDNKIGQVCIEYIRAVSKERFVERPGIATEIEMKVGPMNVTLLIRKIKRLHLFLIIFL